ncbi:MAG: toll/interleukin-1 receptor domain-containing protein [Candidatus Acidiferrales bacterium]
MKEFSLPSTNDWPGDKDAYVLSMVEDASDQVLIDLAQHVGFHFEETVTPRVDPPFWRKGMLRLFVTHLSEHRAFAAELQEALRNFGISGFIAHRDIEPTQEWQTEIETALATCDALVALLHEGFHASNWTDQEIGSAMGRGVPVFAVRFGEDPYGFIGRFQAFDGNCKSAKTLARELFDSYSRNKQTQRRMSEVLIRLFEESSSFAEAKMLIGHLESLTSWEPSFSSRVKSAVKSNSQVSGSWGVPERVTALAGKWAKSGV